MFLDKEKIRKLRLDSGWTQQQLADACDVSMRTVQRIEKDGQASMETTSALVAVFKVNRDDLLRISEPVEYIYKQRRLPMVVSGIIGIAIGTMVTLLVLSLL